MIVEELLTKLGFTANLAPLQNYISKLSAAKIQIFAVAAVIEETGRRLTSFFSKSLEGIEQEGRFAQQLGLTVQQLQQLQYAAKISGGSVDDLATSLKSLSKNIFEASEGVGSGIEVFGRLGISTTVGGKLRTTTDVFLQLADKLKNLAPEQQQDFAAKVGISNSTLLLLQKGSAGIRQLTDEATRLGLYSEKYAKSAEDYADSLRRVNQVFSVLRNQIAIGLAPILTKIVNETAAWVAQNKEFLKLAITFFIKTLIGILTLLFGIIGQVVVTFGFFYSIVLSIEKAIKSVIDELLGFKNTLQVLGIAAFLASLVLIYNQMWKIVAVFKIAREAVLVFGVGFRLLIVAGTLLTQLTKGIVLARNAMIGLDVATYLVPALIIAAIATLALLIQDIYVWATGGKSALKAVFLSWLPGFKYAGKIVMEVLHFIERAFKSVFSGIRSEFNKVISFFEHGVKRVEDLFSRLHFGHKDLSGVNVNASSSVAGMIPAGTVNNSNVSNSANSNTSANTTQNFNISVSSNSHKDVADAVKRGIYDASRQANRNNYSPVAL